MKTAIMLFALAVVLPLSANADTTHVRNPHDQGHPTTRSDVTDRCSILQSQYDGEIGGYQNHPEYAKASQLHSEGVSACQANNIDVGAMKLEAALRELGIQPAE